MLPMDDRDGWIWLDGDLVPWREARVHVLTHGLHYASAVFEGERAYGGRVLALEEHGRRLLRSAEIMDLACPWDAPALDRAVEQVIAANGFGDAYVRRLIWRGSDVLAVAAPRNRIHAAVAAWPWTGAEGHLKREGIRLNVARWRRPPPECMPHEAKVSAAYAIGTLSRHEAIRQGFDDTLMLDWRGQVSEASGANIFFVEGQRLVTPVPDCFLDGITRRTTIDLAKRRGLEVIERRIMPEELPSFNECFMTGTAAEVTPVSQIADTVFHPGNITRTLVEDYTAEVRPKAAAA